MPRHLHASHHITVDAPVAQAFRYFTPAGETLWVDGWSPTYLHPADGRTEAGMVFTTGQGDELTIWTLVDFDGASHRSCYARCTPASRTGVVEVRCSALDAGRTTVQVSYTMTALNARGEQALQAFEGTRYAAMIDGWAQALAAQRDRLLAAEIP